jgi:hypothetical protein
VAMAVIDMTASVTGAAPPCQMHLSYRLRTTGLRSRLTWATRAAMAPRRTRGPDSSGER